MKKRYVLVLLFLILGQTWSFASSFIDMEHYGWVSRYVDEYFERGIINGTSQNTFSPERYVKREEFVKVIMLAFDYDTDDKSSNFSDVKKDEWYYKYISAAANTKIINGIGDNKFGTGNFVTRQDICTMLLRVLEDKGLKFDDKARIELPFEDKILISDYAYKAVSNLYNLEIINGIDLTHFAPKEYATRVQMIKIIYLCEKLVDLEQESNNTGSGSTSNNSSTNNNNTGSGDTSNNNSTSNSVTGSGDSTNNGVEENEFVEVANLELDKSQLILTEMDSIQLNVSITPDNATNKKVVWESSDVTIVKVTQAGILRALKAGKATITVTSHNGKITTCVVTVKPKIIEVATVNIRQSDCTLKITDTKELTVAIAPTNSTDKTVKWKSSDESIATVSQNGVVTGVNFGTVTITATSQNGKNDSIKMKVIPEENYISVTGKRTKIYKNDIIINNPQRGGLSGMQDFEIVNLGTNQEEYYFISPVRSVLSYVNSVTAEQKKEMLTPMIIKTNANNLGNITKDNSEIMYVDRAGQGQFLSIEPNRNYFWTSGNGGLICSGAGAKYIDGKYVVVDVNNCTWWGGNNANISRIKFEPNTYGSKVEIERYYNYGSIGEQRINVWVTFDWKNNLMAVIDYVKDTVIVYNAQKALEGVRKEIYSFKIPDGNEMVGSTDSTQGYAINGGYLYRLRGNYDQGIHIEVFDMFGNYVDYAEVDPGYKSLKQEAQGIKIYNNKIYFGFTRYNKPEEYGELRNAICFLE